MLRKFFIFIFVLILLCIHVISVDAQRLFKSSRITSICYGSGEVVNRNIPPPKEFFNKKDSKGLATVTIYYDGFPQLAITAMERAALILETILPAGARVTIAASWEKLEEDNVLGQTAITGFALGSEIDALNPFAIYPVSLAEKIAGKQLNEDVGGDMFLALNSSVSWYLGTDGKPSARQYDLITVAIHEICHGLGFYDSMYAEDGTGGYGSRSIPVIFDTFIEDLAGRKLVNATIYPNPSAALEEQLTGGSLWFNGPLVQNYIRKFPQTYTLTYPASKVKLYAPTIWDPGSSVAHLQEENDNASPPVTLGQDALMTPFIGLGEVIHDPGMLTRSILGDLGWINTKITHIKPDDTEEHLSQVILNVVIESDTTYKNNSVGVVYSLNNFLTRDSVIMTPAGQENIFTRTVPIASYETSLKYYFFVEDVFARFYRSPALAASDPYEVFIGTDIVDPVIVHTPAEYYFETVGMINIKATISDNIGIDTAYIEYRKNTGPSKFIGLTRNTAGGFSAAINPAPELFNGGDTFQYRIFAVDNSSRNNITVSPSQGFHIVKIEEIGTPVTSYSTDFTNDADDFFTMGFSVSRPLDFTSNGLHSEHPYAYTGNNDSTLNFFAMLRVPVIFDHNGLIISYREVVLVEPGEPFSEYGDPSFYDYVILEASNDFGETWTDITKGYDSGFRPDWKQSFNSSISLEGNSTATGLESMMATHTIFPLGSDSLSYGDTLLFRFRLYSDPLAVGWGWAIDDLKINQLINNIEYVKAEPVTVYPNPGTGIINIGSLDFLDNKPVRYTVFNSSGVALRNDFINGTSSIIDISDLPQGLYFIRFYVGYNIKIVRYSLVK